MERQKNNRPTIMMRDQKRPGPTHSREWNQLVELESER